MLDLEAVCRAVGVSRVVVVDPNNMKECERVIREELDAPEPSVVIARRPCALLKYVKHEKPFKIDAEKCIGCKMCLKIGCPAISFVDGHAQIDESICVGCGLCEDMCKFGCIERGDA